MKRNQINWNHKAETLAEAMGLTKEQAKDVVSRVERLATDKTSHSEAAAALIEEYEEDPAKQAFGLIILEAAEENVAVSQAFAGFPEAVAEEVDEDDK